MRKKGEKAETQRGEGEKRKKWKKIDLHSTCMLSIIFGLADSKAQKIGELLSLSLSLSLYLSAFLFVVFL